MQIYWNLPQKTIQQIVGFFSHLSQNIIPIKICFIDLYNAIIWIINRLEEVENYSLIEEL